MNSVLSRNTQDADHWVQDNFPKDQPYIYDARGNAVVFKKPIGFSPDNQDGRACLAAPGNRPGMPGGAAGAL